MITKLSTDCLLASRSFKLTGEGFFFLFVMGQNSFDVFGNIVQIMLEDTFSEDAMLKQNDFIPWGVTNGNVDPKGPQR